MTYALRMALAFLRAMSCRSLDINSLEPGCDRILSTGENRGPEGRRRGAACWERAKAT
jgi:hypothetical protein